MHFYMFLLSVVVQMFWNSLSIRTKCCDWNTKTWTNIYLYSSIHAVHIWAKLICLTSYIMALRQENTVLLSCLVSVSDWSHSDSTEWQGKPYSRTVFSHCFLLWPRITKIWRHPIETTNILMSNSRIQFFSTYSRMTMLI